MKQADSSFRKFLTLWAGDFISSVGSGLTSFGLGVYIFQQTGKASYMALVTLLAFLPSLLLSVPAGVLADRYDRRILMVLGDSLSAAGLLFILACLMNGEAQVWQICVGVTISSVFTSLLEPAYKATITDLLRPEQYSRASGMVQLAGSAKYLISPVLAGFLLGIADIRLLLLLDMGTFFVTVVTTLAVRRGIESRVSGGRISFLPEIKEGWKALTGRTGMPALVFMSTDYVLSWDDPDFSVPHGAQLCRQYIPWDTYDSHCFRNAGIQYDIGRLLHRKRVCQASFRVFVRGGDFYGTVRTA